MQTEEAKSKFPVFSQRFNQLRGEMSQADFASFLKISRPTVGFYENGERLPDALTLRKIAEKCNVPSDWLLGLTDNKTHDNVDIGYTLGLSDKAIQKIKSISNTDLYKFKDYLNDVLEQLNLQAFLMCIDNYTKIKDLKVSSEQQKLHDEYGRKMLDFTMNHGLKYASNSDELNRMREQINQEQFTQRGIIGIVNDLIYDVLSQLHYHEPKEAASGEHHEADE